MLFKEYKSNQQILEARLESQKQNTAYNDTLRQKDEEIKNYKVEMRQKDEEIKNYKVEIEALYLKIDSDINRSIASQSEAVIHKKEGMEDDDYRHAIDLAKKAFKKIKKQDDIARFISDQFEKIYKEGGC